MRVPAGDRRGHEAEAEAGGRRGRVWSHQKLKGRGKIPLQSLQGHEALRMLSQTPGLQHGVGAGGVGGELIPWALSLQVCGRFSGRPQEPSGSLTRVLRRSGRGPQASG